MSDQYQELAQYYDELVQENRDYRAIATELSQIIGDRQDVLDIGIGTGLVVGHLLQANSPYTIVGIDTSASLLELAKKKFGDDVLLSCQSISELELDRTFDAAYSRGGAWTFVGNNTETLLASHILDANEIRKSFRCVAKHLRVGGLLIISSSNAYSDNEVELKDGIVHKRTATTEYLADERYALLDYRFYKGETLLAQQTLKLRLLSDRELTPMLEAAGFVREQIDSDRYRVYAKAQTTPF